MYVAVAVAMALLVPVRSRASVSTSRQLINYPRKFLGTRYNIFEK